MDVMLLLQGSALLAVAALAVLAYDREDRTSWKALAAYALLEGIRNLLPLLVPHDLPALDSLGLFLMGCSGLLLLRFCQLEREPSPPSALVFLPVVLGLLALAPPVRHVLGTSGSGTLASLSFTWPGALWAGSILIQGAPRRGATFRGLGIGLLLGGLASGMLDPNQVRGALLPSDKGPGFLSGITLALHVIQTACAGLAALSLWWRHGEASRGLRWGLPAGLFLLLLSGGAMARLAGGHLDRDLRASILSEATSIAATLDPTLVRELRFEKTDGSLPAFKVLGTQMKAHARCTGLRSQYTVALRGHDLIFGPESLEPGDPLASPPGTAYLQPPPNLWQVFRTRQALTLGPATDEYGTFVSAYAPMLDPATGEVLLVVGIDVEARDWSRKVLEARRPSTLFTLALAVLLLGGGHLLVRRPAALRRSWWERHLETLLCLAIGSLLSLWLGTSLQSFSQSQAQRAFQGLTESRGQQMAQALHRAEDKLQEVAQFLSQAPPPVDLANTLGSLAEDGLIGTWEWIPTVPGEGRKAYETRAPEGAGRPLWDKGPGGSPMPSPSRPVHHPVAEVVPAKGHEALRGFDHASVPEHLRAIQAAGTTRFTAATPGVDLPQGGRGILLFTPVKPRSGPAGHLMGTLRLDTLLQGVVLESGSGLSPELDISLYETSASGQQALLAHARGTRDLSEDRVQTTVPVFRFSRSYLLVLSAPPTHPALLRSWVGLGGGLGTLLLTGLMALLVHTMVGRHLELERRIQARTAELRESEASYRRQFAENISVMLLLDPRTGCIVDANQAAQAFYGYSHEQLTGMTITDINQTSPQDAFQAMASVLALRRGSFQFQHRLRDGSVRDVEVFSTLIQFEGRPVLHSIVHDITTRKLAEAELLQKTRLQQLLMDLASTFINVPPERMDSIIQDSLQELACFVHAERAGVFLADEATRTCRCTQSWQAMDLMPRMAAPVPLQDLPEWELMHRYGQVLHLPDVNQLHEGPLRRSLREHGIRSVLALPLRHLERTLGWITFETLTAPRAFLEAERRLLNVFTQMVTNLQLRKAADASLRQSEERLSQIIEATQVGTWEWNVQTGECQFNDRWARLVGYTMAELSPVSIQTWMSLAHPEDLAQSGQALEAHFAGRTDHYEFEGRMRHKDGHWIWVHDRGRVTARTPDGQPLLMSGTHMDITPRKLIEEQVKAERDLFASGPVSVFVWKDDPGRTVLYVSENVEALLGYPSRELMTGSCSFRDLMHPEDAGPVLASAHAALRGGAQHLEHTYRLRCRDGSYRWFHDVTLVRREGDTFLGLHGYLMDLTPQKQAEEELREATRRAADLAKLAERANAAKGEFLAHMSHEIRTPLHGILGMAEVLDATELTPEQREHVHAINRSGSTLLVLLNDILDFSKIEAGQLTLEAAPFHLEPLVLEVADLFRSRIGTRPVELIVDLDPDLPATLCGDAGRLRQVLMNLVSNAVKFTDQGHVLIRTQHHGHRWRLEVADTGIGIDPAAQERLFQPFIQADASTARRFGGTGLGLALVKRITEAMGGAIHLESTPGQGARFILELPVQLPAEGPAEEPAPIRLDGLRILVVDDLALNRQLFTRQLESFGASVEACSSGETAIAQVEAAEAAGSPFQTVLLDLQLGEGLDGIETCLRLRPGREDLSLVAITGTASRGDAERMADMGFDGFLTKPLGARILAGALQAALRTAGQGRPSLVTRHSLAPIQPRLHLSEHPLAGLSILVAEDHEVNQVVARRFLEDAGAQVDVAATGLEALEMLEIKAFDLTLMDCQMPEVDGFEATRRIRASGNRVPIIAMTAHAMAGDRDRCLAAGMDSYLTKPITRDVLVREVAHWTHRLTGVMPPSQAPQLESPATHAAASEPASTPTAPVPGGMPLPPEELGLDRHRFQGLWDVFGHSAPVMRETVLTPFVVHTRPLLEQLEAWGPGKDDEGFRRAAHTLKGSSRTLGLDALGDLAERLEHQGLKAEPSDRQAWVEAAWAHFRAAEAYFERF